MNFSHGEYEYHQSVIDNTRKAVASECFQPTVVFDVVLTSQKANPDGRPVAIALDTVSAKSLLRSATISDRFFSFRKVPRFALA